MLDSFTKFFNRVAAILHQNGTNNTCAGHVGIKKGDDVCVTSREEDYFICLQFSSEDRKKLKVKKAYQLKKSIDIFKVLIGCLLGSDEMPPSPPSTACATSKSSTSDSLHLIFCL